MHVKLAPSRREAVTKSDRRPGAALDGREIRPGQVDQVEGVQIAEDVIVIGCRRQGQGLESAVNARPGSKGMWRRVRSLECGGEVLGALRDEVERVLVAKDRRVVAETGECLG
jgi:hypothetical protein